MTEKQNVLEEKKYIKTGAQNDSPKNTKIPRNKISLKALKRLPQKKEKQKYFHN